MFYIKINGQRVPIEKPLGKFFVVLAFILCIPAFLVSLAVAIPTMLVILPFIALAYLFR